MENRREAAGPHGRQGRGKEQKIKPTRRGRVGGGWRRGRSGGPVAKPDAVSGPSGPGRALFFWATRQGAVVCIAHAKAWASISKNIEPRDNQMDSNMRAIPTTFYAY